MSAATQRRASRRGSTRNSNNQIRENTSLSQAHVERLELELVKCPGPSAYYKKKIAANMSKELNVTQKLIMLWLNLKEKETLDADAKVDMKSPVVVKKEMVAPVIAKVAPAKSEEEIEIIDLDDDEDETLLNVSTETNKSTSLGEASSIQKKVENPKEDSKTFVRTVKVKSKPCVSVTNTNKPNTEALKLRISELESKTVDLEKQKRDLAIHSKQKYDTLLNEYKNNLENKIGPMIESYKNDLTKKEKEIAELRESQTKLTSSENHEKELLKQLKDKDKKINLVEQKLKTTETNLKKKEEERLKSLKQMKDSQTLLKSKFEEELTKKSEELEKATKKSLKLKEKFEKSKEEFEKKNPMQEKEISELKEAHNKLKKELVQKEKELQSEAKEVQKLSKLEDEKKSLSKKISKLETDSLQKNKSLDALKLKITQLEKDLKNKSGDLENKKKAFEEENKQIEDRVTELCAVLSRKEELLKEFQQREESLEGKSMEAKTKLSEVKSKLKEKNVALRKELDEKNTSLTALKKEVIALQKDRDEKTEEISAKAKTISQCKTDLENAKNVINTTIAELKKTIDSKDQEISELEKEIQRKVSVFNEKLEAKSVELRDKDTEIEAMSKKLAESNELSEKIKEKQLNIIKLSHTVYEKDSVIAKKEEEIQKLSARNLELGRETERKLEMRSFQEINNQNKLRHELLLQQQEMRKCLEAEIEASRLQVEEEKLQAEKRVEAARAEVELEAAGERLVLVQRLEERKRLLCKVKMVLLYKSSPSVGREKGSQTSGVKLRLPYNWPLVQQPEFHLSEALQTLLSRPTFPLLKVPSLLRPHLKRKAEAEVVAVPSKRRRVSEICWPVMVYQPKSLKRKTEQPAPSQSDKKVRLEVSVAPLQNSLILSLSLHISFPLPILTVSPKPEKAAPLLMLTYEQPSPITEQQQQEEEKEKEQQQQKEEEDDIGLIAIQCYNYKLTRPAVRSRTTGLISPSEKVTARRYRKPSFTPVTGRGKKRSFLEFLETLSCEEMADYSSEMTEEESSLPDLQVRISPPAKKHRYSLGPGVTSRTFPTNMDQMDFYFDFDDSHNICQYLFNILLDSVVH